MQINTLDQFSASVFGEQQDNCADGCCGIEAEATPQKKKKKAARLTIEHARECYAAKGLVLLETVYINNRTLMRFWCPVGKHEHTACLDYIKTPGKGCGACRFHWTIDTVTAAFAAQELLLLDTVFINTTTPMWFWCWRGNHAHSCTSKDLVSKRTGTKCGRCRYPWTLETARDAFFAQGLLLLDTVFINTTTPMRFSCIAGNHTHKMTLGNLVNQQQGCGLCKPHKYTLAEASTIYWEHGYLLMETTYNNIGKPMRCWCMSGNHEHTVSLSMLVHQNSKCSWCPGKAFNRAAPTLLYYLEFRVSPQRTVYKIGVTNRTVEARYKGCKTPYSILWQGLYSTGDMALRVEGVVRHYYNALRCSDTPVQGLGNTELFDFNIIPTLTALAASLEEAQAEV
jgi:hypothetical protein